MTQPNRVQKKESAQLVGKQKKSEKHNANSGEKIMLGSAGLVVALFQNV